MKIFKEGGIIVIQNDKGIKFYFPLSDGEGDYLSSFSIGGELETTTYLREAADELNGIADILDMHPDIEVENEEDEHEVIWNIIIPQSVMKQLMEKYHEEV